MNEIVPGQLPGFGDEFARYRNGIASAVSERSQAINDTMEGVQALAISFANAMVDQSMPVTRATQRILVAEPSEVNDWRPELLEIRSVPVWLAVKHTDLSDRPLRSAHVVEEIRQYSLLSHSLSDIHYKNHPIDPAEAQSTKVGYHDKLNYFERFIGITAIGGLVVVHNSYSRGSDYSSYDSSGYTISRGTFQPKELFDTDAPITLRAHTEKMQQRLTACFQDYLKQYDKEQEAGPVVREPDYYLEKLLPIPEKKDSTKRNGRKRFGMRRR